MRRRKFLFCLVLPYLLVSSLGYFDRDWAVSTVSWELCEDCAIDSGCRLPCMSWTAFALAPCVEWGERQKKRRKRCKASAKERHESRFMKRSIIARARSRQANANANAGQSHKLNAFSMCLATDYGQAAVGVALSSDLASLLHLFHFISVNLAELAAGSG